MDKFTKWFEWTKKNKDLTQNGMLLICVLVEKWEYHKHQPFHYSLKWLGEQIKVKKDDTVLEALNNLVELNLITVTKQRENGNKGKNYYTINQETLDKLSGNPYTSTPTVVKEEPSKPAPMVGQSKKVPSTMSEFNDYLLKIFDEHQDDLLYGNNMSSQSALDRLFDQVSTKETVRLFGSQNNYNANFYKQYRLWYQKQKDLKSQVI